LDSLCHRLTSSHPTEFSALFPYTTLFRSGLDRLGGERTGLEEACRPQPFIDAHPVHVPACPCVRREHFQLTCLHNQGGLCKQVKDRKSTRLNSSHVKISYPVFCLKKILQQ